MLRMAVSDMGLSPEEFWELSWYEWGLYLLRIKKKQEEEKFRWETSWDQTRILWATTINIHAGKGKGVKPKDLIELSFDKEVKKDYKKGEALKRFQEKK